MVDSNYFCDGQMNLFDFSKKPICITKPIRLIELFAGYGSQAMALKKIGAKFEHYRVIEFDKYAIASYNAIHGTDFPTMDITKIHCDDLGIENTSDFTYLLTYSFPCTDLSVAGKQAGMSKGSGTRSGLLWEVERILSEIIDGCGELPQNASDRVVGSQTEQRLELNKQGTSNCLTSVQKDNLVMESKVLTPKRTEYGKQIRKAYESRHNMTELEPRKDDVSNTLTTVQKDNLVLENVKIRQATKDGSIECEIGGCFDASYPNSKIRRGRAQDKGNTCPTLTAQNQEVVGIEKVSQNHITTQYRIRKLTPRECGRLMGVSDEDIDKMAAVNSNTQLYKQFGNSIVVDVMCAMFQCLNIRQGE